MILRGIEGFGADSRLHTARILRLSEISPSSSRSWTPTSGSSRSSPSSTRWSARAGSPWRGSRSSPIAGVRSRPARAERCGGGAASWPARAPRSTPGPGGRSARGWIAPLQGTWLPGRGDPNPRNACPGAGVTAAHGLHHVGRPDGLIGERLGELPGKVDPNLLHGLDHLAMDLPCGGAAGGPDLDPHRETLVGPAAVIEGATARGPRSPRQEPPTLSSASNEAAPPAPPRPRPRWGHRRWPGVPAARSPRP